MEMTKMLLPTVPSMAPKIHSNDQYPLFGRLKPYRKQCIIYSKLEALRRDKQFMEVVRDYHKLLQTNLLSYAEPTRDRVIRRLNGHPSLSNEEFRSNNVLRIATTAEKRNTEIQSQPQLQPKPEPQSEPEPKSQPEPEPNPEPEAEPRPKESEPVLQSKFELELEPGLLEWKRELAKPTTPQSSPKSKEDYDSEFDYMEFTSDICRRYESSDSETDFYTKLKMNLDSQLLKAYDRRCKKRVKRKLFKCRIKSGRVLLSSRPYVPSPYSIQTSNMANRSLLKSQRNVNSAPCSPTSVANDFRQQLSNNQEKKSHDLDDLIKNMPYSQEILMNEDLQDAEINQLLSYFSDDLLKTPDIEEALSFQHEQINVSEMSEYISSGESMMTKSLSKIEDISQQNKRKKNEEHQRQIANDIKRNTLSDHCYHLNEPKSDESLETEELSEESDEEEEIDVVSFEKQVSYFNLAQPQRNTASRAKLVANAAPVVRRPRGRPPGLNSAKRKTHVNRVSSPPLKRCRTQHNQQAVQSQQNYARQNRELCEDTERRKQHNDMERQRRISMKMLYDELRTCVPTVAHNEKASKVSILKQGKAYVTSLVAINNSCQAEMRKLRKEQQILKNRLEALQKARRTFYFQRK